MISQVAILLRHSSPARTAAQPPPSSARRPRGARKPRGNEQLELNRRVNGKTGCNCKHRQRPAPTPSRCSCCSSCSSSSTMAPLSVWSRAAVYFQSADRHRGSSAVVSEERAHRETRTREAHLWDDLIILDYNSIFYLFLSSRMRVMMLGAVIKMT